VSSAGISPPVEPDDREKEGKAGSLERQ